MLGVLFFTSCHRTLTHDKLVEYIANPDHGLTKERTTSGISIKVTYRPSDFLVAQEMMALPDWDEQKYQEARANYGKNMYFILSLSQNGNEVLTGMVADGARFSEMVQQLSFGMGDKVIVTTAAKDTLHLVDYVYPRMYGMSSGTDMLFAFEKGNTLKEGKLYVKLLECGLNIGTQQFEFEVKDIEQAPGLRIEKKAISKK